MPIDKIYQICNNYLVNKFGESISSYFLQQQILPYASDKQDEANTDIFSNGSMKTKYVSYQNLRKLHSMFSPQQQPLLGAHSISVAAEHNNLAVNKLLLLHSLHKPDIQHSNRRLSVVFHSNMIYH